MKYKGTTTTRLDRIEHMVRGMLGNQNVLFEIGEYTMTQLSDALDEMERNAEADRDADAAAKALIVKLGELIVKGAAGAPTPENFAKLKAIGQGMVDRAADLSAAVVAGTPAEEPPAEPPVEEPPVDTGASTAGIKSTE